MTKKKDAPNELSIYLSARDGLDQFTNRVISGVNPIVGYGSFRKMISNYLTGHDSDEDLCDALLEESGLKGKIVSLLEQLEAGRAQMERLTERGVSNKHEIRRLEFSVADRLYSMGKNIIDGRASRIVTELSLKPNADDLRESHKSIVDSYLNTDHNANAEETS